MVVEAKKGGKKKGGEVKRGEKFIDAKTPQGGGGKHTTNKKTVRRKI